MDKLINLLTLGFARGYRTFLCTGVIITLALLQKYLGMQIDQPTWLILLAVLVACLRAAINGQSAAALLLALCLALPAAAADIGGTSDQQIMRDLAQVRAQETALRIQLEQPGQTPASRDALEKQADALCTQDTRLLVLSMSPYTNAPSAASREALSPSMGRTLGAAVSGH